MRIPDHGLPRDELFRRLESFRSGDVPWRDGKTLAYVYDPGPEAEAIIKQAFSSYLTENALDPTAFPSTMKLENEVVAMSAAHLGGDSKVAGSFTTGGTESIILAMKTARDYGRKVRKIAEPEVVLPNTAHAAFHKAAHFLDMRLKLVPADSTSFRADPAAMRAAIGPDTIMIVGSAVSYAHGVVDPIRELGQLALEKNLLFHVDACMGGFLLPYFRRLGRAIPDFDFTVPGVTSISMDLHKYGFAAKGASVVLYRDAALRKHQLYACANWTGYTIVNTTIQSAKSGGPVAAAWATLNHFGDAGYLALAKEMLAATERISAGIARIPGLHLVGAPDMNLVAFASDEVDVFHVVDEMRTRGWLLQPQLGYGASPANIHLSLGPKANQWVAPLLKDLAECVELARGLTRDPDLAQAREGLAAMVREAGPDGLEQLLGALGGAGGAALPERMAVINGLLDSLPPAGREQLLLEYLNMLFRQPGPELERAA